MTVVVCCGCHLPISDRFLLTLIDRPWHEDCLRCATCRRVLNDRCFRRHGQLYCPDDFYRRFGSRCVNCCHGFAPDDLVRDAKGGLFHLDCFSCMVCGRRIETGQEVLVSDDATILCKEDGFIHGRMVTGELEAFHRTIVATDPSGTSVQLDQQGTTLTTDRQGTSLATDRYGFSLATVSPKGISVEMDRKGASTVSGDSQGTGVVYRDQQEASVTDGDSMGTRAISGDPQGTSVISEAQRIINMKLNSGTEDSESTDSSDVDLEASLKTGPEVALCDREGPGTLAKRRGPRTTIRVQQLELLKLAFARNPKPMAMEREQLRHLTGLDMRVIQVWFQNRRSKERRKKMLNSASSSFHHSILYESTDCHWSTGPLMPFDLSDGESERGFLYHDGLTLGNSHPFHFRGNSTRHSFDPKTLPLLSFTPDAIDRFPTSESSLEMPTVARDGADGDAASWTSL